MPASVKTLILVNHSAGRGRAKHAQPAVARYLRERGFQAEFAFARSPEELRRSAAAAASAGYKQLLVLGGDGTFLHLVNGAFGHDLVLGILPAGNGNDIAAALGIPEDPVAAARAFLTSAPRRVDLVRARFADDRSELYVGTGGLGLDAEAARLANGRFRRLPGVWRYLAGGFCALARFQPLELDAELDNEHWSGPILFAVASNAPAYGAGVKIAPAAQIDDGWLDVTLVGALPWTRLVEAIPIVLRTGDLRWPEIWRSRARRVRLRTDRPALFHGDGEVLGSSPVELEVLPGAIQVRAPRRVDATLGEF